MMRVQASLEKNFRFISVFVFLPIILFFPLSYFLCSHIYAQLVLYSAFLSWHHYYYYFSWYLSSSTSSHLFHLLCPLFYSCLLDWAGNKRWLYGKEIFHLDVQSVNKSVELILWSVAFFLSIKQNKVKHNSSPWVKLRALSSARALLIDSTGWIICMLCNHYSQFSSTEIIVVLLTHRSIAFLTIRNYEKHIYWGFLPLQNAWICIQNKTTGVSFFNMLQNLYVLHKIRPKIFQIYLSSSKEIPVAWYR